VPQRHHRSNSCPTRRPPVPLDSPGRNHLVHQGNDLLGAADFKTIPVCVAHRRRGVRNHNEGVDLLGIRRLVQLHRLQWSRRRRRSIRTARQRPDQSNCHNDQPKALVHLSAFSSCSLGCLTSVSSFKLSPAGIIHSVSNNCAGHIPIQRQCSHNWSICANNYVVVYSSWKSSVRP